MRLFLFKMSLHLLDVDTAYTASRRVIHLDFVQVNSSELSASSTFTVYNLHSILAAKVVEIKDIAKFDSHNRTARNHTRGPSDPS